MMRASDSQVARSLQYHTSYLTLGLQEFVEGAIDKRNHHHLSCIFGLPERARRSTEQGRGPLEEEEESCEFGDDKYAIVGCVSVCEGFKGEEKINSAMEARVHVDDLRTRLIINNGEESEEGGHQTGSCGSDEFVCESLSVDDMLVKWVGEFGLAQLAHFIAVSFAWTLEGLHTFVMVFADHQPAWQCREPALLSSSINNVLAAAGNSTGSIALSCTASSSLCSMDPRFWEWVGGPGVSTVSQFNLICGDEYKVGLAQSAFFIGGFLGAGVYGHLSDSFLGRKGALFLACLLTGLAGLATSFAPMYWIYVLLRGLTGLNCGGIGLSSFVLATEPVGPSRRGQVGMSAFYFFSFGIMTIPAYAIWTPSWRWLYVATSAPSLLYCALVLPFIWESPRWYLVQGRVQEAMKVLRAFAKWNGKHVPAGIKLTVDEDNATEDLNPLDVNYDKLAEDTREAKCDYSNADNKTDAMKETGIPDTVKASGTLLDVFRNPGTRSRMLIMVVIWFLCAVVYYGITLNVVNLGANLYVSVFLNALVEMPAFTITALLLDRFGRRWMLASAMFLSGICCLAGSFLFVEPGVMLGTIGAGAEVFKVLRVLCSVIGIFGMAGSYNLIYIYTSELFPTVVRNAALGLTSQMAGIGSIIAPAVVVLGRYNSFLPFMIFGVMAMVGAILSLGLPETLHQPLFETMQSMQRSEKSRV